MGKPPGAESPFIYKCCLGAAFRHQKNKKYTLNSHVEKSIALKKLPEEIKMLEENAGRVLFLFQSTHLTNKGK